MGRGHGRGSNGESESRLDDLDVSSARRVFLLHLMSTQTIDFDCVRPRLSVRRPERRRPSRYSPDSSGATPAVAKARRTEKPRHRCRLEVTPGLRHGVERPRRFTMESRARWISTGSIALSTWVHRKVSRFSVSYLVEPGIDHTRSRRCNGTLPVRRSDCDRGSVGPAPRRRRGPS